jgi:plasmid stability protein
MSHRTSIYFDESLHQALRMKAAVTGQSVSDLVNEAVKLSLAEDATDFAALDARAIAAQHAVHAADQVLRREGT